jgi:alpha-D-ribose 1-methylphosphonate 5-triphosphate synthase subunit PhnH
MNTMDLSRVGAGFPDASFASQAVFRAALRALSQPGRPVDIDCTAGVPAGVQAASAMLLLALLDSDCTLWLSPSLRASDAAAWLRFHTGCGLVDDPAQARFAWIAAADALPRLDAFAHGSHEYPDQSTTCVVDVAAFVALADVDVDADMAATAPAEVSCWRISGPGVRDAVRLGVRGPGGGWHDDLTRQWRHNHGLFPRGVDLYLASPGQIAGLPRSARLDLHGGS